MPGEPLFPGQEFPSGLYQDSFSEASVPGIRDDDLFQAIVAILEETGEFDAVHYPCESSERGQSAAEIKVAILEPSDFAEPGEIFDDGGTETRTTRYTLTIHFREPDEQACARELDRLSNVASNAISGQSLLGFTFPDMTRLKRGKWNKRTSPEQKLIVNGEFSYLITGFAGRDETE